MCWWKKWVYPMTRFKIYRNLNNGKLSIKHPCGKVSGWAKNITLCNVKLIVNEKGRDRVREEQVKNVHSFIEGGILYTEVFNRKDDNPSIEYSHLSDLEYQCMGKLWRKDPIVAYYNPYTTDFWVNKDTGEELKDTWDWCSVSEDGVVLLK